MLSAVQTSALQLLRPQASPLQDKTAAPTDSPIVAATKATANPLFSADKPSVTQVKLALFDQLGQALGIDREEYASLATYARAIGSAVAAMETDPNGAAIKAAIEDKLDLNKIGVTLDQLVGAMMEPGGEADRSLDRALAEMLGVEPSGPAGPSQGLGTDDLGLYGPAAGR